MTVLNSTTEDPFFFLFDIFVYIICIKINDKHKKILDIHKTRLYHVTIINDKR
jgi:hypothetical protein